MSSILLPHEIDAALRQIRHRSRWLDAANGLLLSAAALLAATLIAIGIDALVILFEPWARTLLTVTALALASAVLILYCLRPLLTPRPRSIVAQQVEAHVPALQERWSTVAELAESADPPCIRGSDRLIEQVTREAVALHGAVDPGRIASPRRLRRPAIVFAAALLAFGIIALAWPIQTGILLQRFCAPTRPISLTQLTSLSGLQTVARGERVTLQAAMSGRLRSSGELLMRSGASDQRVDLLAAADSHVLSHEIRSAEASFDYCFRAGDGQTPWQRITVAERPSIAEAHYRLTPPTYSRLPEDEKDTLPTRLHALQGSELTLSITPTKPLARLELQFEDESRAQLARHAESYVYQTTLESSMSFSIVLTDDLGLTNLSPPRCRITVFEDKPPTVQITEPAREVAVRPDEKLPIAFEARDDLGVSSAELIVTTGEGPDEKVVQEVPIPLGKQEGARRVRGRAELDLKPLALQHGDRLSYAVRVRDTRDAAAVGERDTGIGATTRPADLAQGDATSQPAQAAAASTAPAAGNQALAAGATQPSGAPAGTADALQSQPAFAAADSQPASSQPALAQARSGDRRDQQNQRNAGDGAQARADGSSRSPQSGPAREGASPPPVNMTMRPYPGQDKEHESESRKQSLIVDKWAGTFEGQAREKLRIAIDEYLARLDAALAAAQKHTEELRQPPATVPAAHPPALARARTALSQADRTVAELRAKSDDTPYAFMGLQLHNIKQAHVAPAQRHLSSVTTRPADDPASPHDVDQAWYHIVRAREALAGLTRKYEEIKRQEKTAEAAERISKMHQVFVEDVMALLEQSKPTINARRNRMIEITEEFAKAIQELAEQVKKMDADLARILANDPDLLRKFLDRAETTNLRDELTKLHWRQQDVQQQSAIATTRPAEGGAAITAEFLIAVGRQQQQLAEYAGRSHDKMEIWMPKEPGPAAGGLTKAAADIGEAARILHDSAIAAAAQELDRAVELATRAVEHLSAAQTEVLAVSASPAAKDPTAALFSAHRLTELDRLLLEENAAIQKVRAVKLKRAGRALGLEQVQIRLATIDLAERIARQLSFIQGISPAAVKKLDELIGILNGQIPGHQQEAGIALRVERWDLAHQHAARAVEGYVLAERIYDEALTLIEKVLADRAAQVPPMVPPPPALEQLLEALKREKENLDKLGFAPPRLNLQILSDWAGEGEGGGGGRGQDGQSSQQQRNQDEQARQRAAQARAEAARREAERVQRQAQEARQDSANQRDRMLADARRIAKTRPADDDVASTEGARGNTSGQERDFNIFVSKLEEDITQARGTNPPSQYKEAIQSYFEVISNQPSGK